MRRYASLLCLILVQMFIDGGQSVMMMEVMYSFSIVFCSLRFGDASWKMKE